jgi:hypothetical protein
LAGKGQLAIFGGVFLRDLFLRLRVLVEHLLERQHLLVALALAGSQLRLDVAVVQVAI